MDFNRCAPGQTGLRICVLAAITFSYFCTESVQGQARNEPAAPQVTRIWSDNSGTFSVEARLLKINPDSITLRKLNRVVIQVPFNRLSDFDLAYVKKENSKSKVSTALLTQEGSSQKSNLGTKKTADAPDVNQVAEPANAQPKNADNSLATDADKPRALDSDTGLSPATTAPKRFDSPAVLQFQKSKPESAFNASGNATQSRFRSNDPKVVPPTDNATQPNLETPQANSEFQKRPDLTPQMTRLPATNLLPQKITPPTKRLPLVLTSPQTNSDVQTTEKPFSSREAAPALLVPSAGTASQDSAAGIRPNFSFKSNTSSDSGSFSDTTSATSTLPDQNQMLPQIKKNADPLGFPQPKRMLLNPFQNPNVPQQFQASSPLSDKVTQSSGETNPPTDNSPNSFPLPQKSSDFQPSKSSDFQPAKSSDFQPATNFESRVPQSFESRRPEETQPQNSNTTEFQPPGKKSIPLGQASKSP